MTRSIQEVKSDRWGKYRDGKLVKGKSPAPKKTPKKPAKKK